MPGVTHSPVARTSRASLLTNLMGALPCCGCAARGENAPLCSKTILVSWHTNPPCDEVPLQYKMHVASTITLIDIKPLEISFPHNS